MEAKQLTDGVGDTFVSIFAGTQLVFHLTSDGGKILKTPFD